MFKVRQDLIEKELLDDINQGFEFHYQRLSNKFLDWLFRHYYIYEMCENFYDKEDCENEDKRVEFCNWQDAYFKNNWMSQNELDIFSKDILKSIKNFPKSIKDRLYFAKKDDEIRIYFYGRDYWESDYWFIFKKREKRL